MEPVRTRLPGSASRRSRVEDAAKAEAPLTDLPSAAVAVIDTDILIDHLRGHHRFQARGRSIAYSVVTRAELFAGTDGQDRIRELLDGFDEVQVDGAIAEMSGGIRRDRGLDLADALIAATAVTLRAPLITRNRRHFEGIRGLELQAADP